MGGEQLEITTTTLSSMLGDITTVFSTFTVIDHIKADISITINFICAQYGNIRINRCSKTKVKYTYAPLFKPFIKYRVFITIST